jgi:hypothetical protein
MVMALVEGETLDRKLKRDGRLPQTDVDRLLGPLLDGLEQLMRQVSCIVTSSPPTSSSIPPASRP